MSEKEPVHHEVRGDPSPEGERSSPSTDTDGVKHAHARLEATFEELGIRVLPAHAVLSAHEVTLVSGAGISRVLKALASKALRGAFIGGRKGWRVVYEEVSRWVTAGAPEAPVVYEAPSSVPPAPPAPPAPSRDITTALRSLVPEAEHSRPVEHVDVEPVDLQGVAVYGGGDIGTPAATQGETRVMLAPRRSGADIAARVLDEMTSLPVPPGVTDQAVDAAHAHGASADSLLGSLRQKLGR